MHSIKMEFISLFANYKIFNNFAVQIRCPKKILMRTEKKQRIRSERCTISSNNSLLIYYGPPYNTTATNGRQLNPSTSRCLLLPKGSRLRSRQSHNFAIGHYRTTRG